MELSEFKVNGREHAFLWRHNALGNSFNNYLQSVFTVDDRNIPSTAPSDRTQINPLTVTEQGVLNLLFNVDTKKAKGPDNFRNIFLKRYAECVVKYTWLMFNKSLKSYTAPGEWKTAKVIPIHKSASKIMLSNCRPILLTSSACILLEHVILKHITIYLEEQHIFPPAQHGFRIRAFQQLLNL